MQRPKVSNLADLSVLAGVSISTVSRSLADNPLIAKKTRERIQQLAREHDFQINIAAQNFRLGRTGAVGVVLPLGHETKQHLTDPFFMSLIASLADALADRRYDLLLSRVIPSDDRWLQGFVDSGKVDGVNAEDCKVVLFAGTNTWYVQPYMDSYDTPIKEGGTWRNDTHLGAQYAALLVKKSYKPPMTTGKLPSSQNH